MTSREQTLAFVLVGLIMLMAAGVGGYFFILTPLQQQRKAEQSVTEEVAKLEQQLAEQQKSLKKLAVYRASSLPADHTLAENEYAIALQRLIDATGASRESKATIKNIDNSPRAVPEIAKGKPIYRRVACDVVMKKANMWDVLGFLHSYYNLGLLQQITSLKIQRDDDGGAKSKDANRRGDLTLTLTTEAIIVDGAENRRTLFRIPNAFAAIGGGAMHRAMMLAPEPARVIRPEVVIPTLSPVGRDYTLIVQKDPFYGPLQEKKPEKPPSERPLRIASIRDVKVKPNEKPSPVRYSVSGDGADSAVVTAVAEGKLYAPGALKVDPKEYTIELPATSATDGTSTITVIATSADGKKTEKTTFKVSLAEPDVIVDKRGPDISPHIILIYSTPRSDNSAVAMIRDQYNNLRYSIDATPKGVAVEKQWFTTEWKADRDYDKETPGVLRISDDSTKTDRTLQVIAVDGDGLIVADLKPVGSAPTPPKSRGPGFGRPATTPPKQGSASPMAALGGNRITAVPEIKLYRWTVGQSLAALKPISDDDAKKILETTKNNGPVLDLSSILD